MFLQFFIEHSIVIGLVMCILVLMLLCMLLSPFFAARKMARLQGITHETLSDEQLPEVSIVLLASDRADDFEGKVDLLLQQSYPASYRLIIVADTGDMLVEEIRDKNAGNPRIYCTFLPTSSRYMNRKKLAISIGVKAVTTDWLIFLDAHCTPTSTNWLASMVQHFTPNNRLVMGYSHYDDEMQSYRHFYHLLQSAMVYRDFKKNKAYRNCGMNFATTKRFIETDAGLRNHLHLLCGEYDMIVNNAHGEQCAMELSEESWIQLDNPSDEQWERMKMNDWETRRWLNHGMIRRWLFNLYQATLHLSYLSLISGVVYAALVQHYPCLIACVALLLLFILFRTLSMHGIVKALSPHIPVYALAFYEWRILWTRMFSYLRYKRAGKYEFTCHKA